MKYHFLLLLFLIFISISCRNELVFEPQIDFGDPFQIVSLTEIENNKLIDRTSEILDCRRDDLFLFHGPTQDVRIQNGETTCDGEEDLTIGGTWIRSEIENLDGMLLTFEFSHLYVLHDSLLLGQSELRFIQAYELVNIQENELIFQNHNDFSTPKTQNVWQLKLAR